MATLHFINELGIETPPKKEYKNEGHRLVDIEDLAKEIAGNGTKSVSDITIEILAERGIDVDSVFYLPLKQSIERGLALEEARRVVIERAESDSTFEPIVEQLEGVIEENNASIKAKHMHYNKYREEDPTEIPEIMLDIEGNSYYDKLLPLGAQSVRDAKDLAIGASEY